MSADQTIFSDDADCIPRCAPQPTNVAVLEAYAKPLVPEVSLIVQNNNNNNNNKQFNKNSQQYNGRENNRSHNKSVNSGQSKATGSKQFKQRSPPSPKNYQDNIKHSKNHGSLPFASYSSFRKNFSTGQDHDHQHFHHQHNHNQYSRYDKRQVHFDKTLQESSSSHPIITSPSCHSIKSSSSSPTQPVKSSSSSSTSPVLLVDNNNFRDDKNFADKREEKAFALQNHNEDLKLYGDLIEKYFLQQQFQQMDNFMMDNNNRIPPQDNNKMLQDATTVQYKPFIQPHSSERNAMMELILQQNQEINQLKDTVNNLKIELCVMREIHNQQIDKIWDDMHKLFRIYNNGGNNMICNNSYQQQDRIDFDKSISPPLAQKIDDIKVADNVEIISEKPKESQKIRSDLDRPVCNVNDYSDNIPVFTSSATKDVPSQTVAITPPPQPRALDVNIKIPSSPKLSEKTSDENLQLLTALQSPKTNKSLAMNALILKYLPDEVKKLAVSTINREHNDPGDQQQQQKEQRKPYQFQQEQENSIFLWDNKDDKENTILDAAAIKKQPKLF